MGRTEFTLNGTAVVLEIEGHETLVHVLRERLGIKSVKEGCSIGECGVCTVLIDDEPHYSCLTLAAKAHRRDVKTVEFLGDRGMLHPLQEAFIASGAVQCGYCTPGMLLSAYGLLLKNEDPDDWEIKTAISGNLCRCTGYVQIVEAVKKAAAEMRKRRSGEAEKRKQEGEAQRSQESGDRIQESEVRSQNSGGRSQETESRRQESGDRIQEAGGRRQEGGGTLPSQDSVLKVIAETPGVKIVAGGTDVLVKARKAGGTADMVDVTRIPGLDHISDKDEHISIGATATHASVAQHHVVRQKAASLAEACGHVGSPQIRNMGTIGGNLVNASPAADSLAPLLIHDGVVTLVSAAGLREMTVEEFIVAPYRTAIREGEVLMSIRVAGLAGYREGYRRVARRAALAISRLSVAWAIKESETAYEDVRLAIGSCTPMPFRAWEPEAFLRGKEKSEPVISTAVDQILKGIVAASGMRPSYAYKLPVLKGLLEQILRG